MINQDTIDKILNTVDIVAEISGDVKLAKKGVSYEGCCPFHREKTPSFKISPAKGIFKCFGCNEGGNVIQYVRRRDNMTFPEAVEYLAGKYNIEYEKREATPEEREAAFRRERLFTINCVALDYFIASYRKSDSARKYAEGRWKKSTIEELQIGYAPQQWQGFMDYAAAAGYKQDVMLEAGLIREKDGRRHDAFVGRLMFPIRDRAGNIVGFSGRTIAKEEGDKKAPKYLNTADTPIFRKKDHLYGMFEGRREAIRSGRINLVEGAPDVVRMYERGVVNTVAPLGTALTDGQVALIRQVAKSVVIICDTDEAGMAAAMKNGETLFRAGLNVSVMVVPKEKDPDEYFKDISNSYEDSLLNHTVDYIHFLTDRRFGSVSSTPDQIGIIDDVCDILCDCDDPAAVDVYIDTLGKKYKPRSAWTTKMADKRNARQMDVRRQSSAQNQDLFQKFGFTIENNCYWAFGRNSNVKWSNFVMTPLAHIRSMTNAKRLYVITNEFGDEQTVELRQEDLVSIQKFRIKVESMGNYIWEAGEAELHKLKRYLYDKTETCEEITQMGWQKRHGFYAWGNGGLHEGRFIRVDDIGILRVDRKAFYLPAFSKIFRHEPQLFQFERRFIHAQGNGITLPDYARKVIGVFGDNAKVALCFLVATIFKDVVTSHTKSFPILNLFGPKGTGKSELGRSLTSFFVADNTAPNINNTTIAALAESVAQVSNAVVHIDEYKNTLDYDKIEFLKGLWDGAGRTRMNMDRDKKREITAVDAGVILSGQEMPTADNALFSRLIFLSFYRTEFSDAEKKAFEELKRIERRGLSHLTNEILSHRKKFEVDFRSAWDYTAADLSERLSDHAIEDRTLKNWHTVLAAFRCLENELRLPFSYREILDIAVQGIIEQNAKTKQNNELSGFWQTVENLVRSAAMWVEVDYKIRYLPQPVRMFGKNALKQLDLKKQYLLLSFNRIASLYQKDARVSGEKKIPKDSLRYYLEHSAEYEGTMRAVKFKQIANAAGMLSERTDPLTGMVESKTIVTSAMVFDYEAVRETYAINIDITSSGADDEPGAKPYIDDNDKPF